MVLPPNYVNTARRDALEARVTAVEGSGPGGGGSGTVTEVAGVAPDVTGDVPLAPLLAALDLDQVENTADADKPISDAALAALAAKVSVSVSTPIMRATAGGWPLSRASFVSSQVYAGYTGPIIYSRVAYPLTADPTDQEYGDFLEDLV